MRLKLLSVALTSMFGFGSQAQMTIDNSMTPSQYVQDVLIGTGVTVSNVTYSGGAGVNEQISRFTDATSNIGFSSGVVLSTGRTSTLPGNPSDFYSESIGSPGDPDIELIPEVANVGQQSFDASILEFDFVPTSNTVSFRFVFGSEEYLEFVNSIADAFGFFVSGPEISGPYSSPAAFPNGAINLALVPGTTEAISISAIYPDNYDGFSPGKNQQYYVYPPAGSTNQLDGYTVPIMITFDVLRDSTYHFKFSIADCADAIYNSAIFLEANSLTSPVELVEEDLGINDLDQFAVTVYPVPVSDRFWISTGEKVMSYSVVDNQGRIVTTGVDLSAGIDCSQWISGLYFIRVKSEKGTSTEPVTVRH